MFQVVKLSDKEKKELYNTYSKEDLIDMVISCNNVIDKLKKDYHSLHEDMAFNMSERSRM